MHRDFQAALEPVGIEPPHVGILTALEETGPISQSELARLFAVSGAHMVQLIDELEERRLVARRRLETDRRSHVIEVLPSAGCSPGRGGRDRGGHRRDAFRAALGAPSHGV